MTRSIYLFLLCILLGRVGCVAAEEKGADGEKYFNIEKAYAKILNSSPEHPDG